MYESVAFFAIASLILDIRRSHLKIRMIFGTLLIGYFLMLPHIYPDDLPYLSNLVFWDNSLRWFFYVFILGFSQLFFVFSPEHIISKIAIVILADYCFSQSHTIADLMMLSLLMMLIIFSCSVVMYQTAGTYLKQILVLFALTGLAFFISQQKELMMFVPVLAGVFISSLFFVKHRREDLFLLSILVVFIYHTILL